MTIIRCSCGATWTVKPDGTPLSWLGHIATDRHTTLGHTLTLHTYPTRRHR